MEKIISKKVTLLIVSMLLFVSSFSSIGQASEDDFTAFTEIKGSFDFSSSERITVMVELDEPSVVEAKHSGYVQTAANISNATENLKSDIFDLIPDSEVTREYHYLFSGLALELPEENVLQLTEIDGVQAVYPTVHYEPTEFEPQIVGEEAFSPTMADSAPYIGAQEAWEQFGVTGDGVTVAIIDTGVDYTHPDLAHAFGEYKGYDFVDDDDDPQEGPGQYHGTHVAGTVAANGSIYGVAPDASLLAYRVLGPQGGTTEDVVAAVELAVLDGVDIMNLSLGNSLNDPDWATSLALDWAMAEGVVAVTSNGNSGPENWTVGSPGTTRDAISVGATQLPYNLYNAEMFTSEDVTYPTADVMGFGDDAELLDLDGETYSFIDASQGLPDDFEDIDAEGKVALIARGEIPFVEKAENAADAGAVATIIYNNLPGEMEFFIPGMALPSLKLDDEDGQKMLQELAVGNDEVTFQFEFAQEVGETLADFSSRGPVYGTWMIKPDVSAPGVDIVSTFPDESYASLQGTSMSSPHVAGAAALLLEKNPDWDTTNVKSALMNTAEPIFDENGDAYPFNAQGTGSIRLIEALSTETLVNPGSYSFGVFDKEEGQKAERQFFELKNLSDHEKQYEMDIEFFNGEKNIKVNQSGNLQVPAGETQQVHMSVMVNVDALDPGYYEGLITIRDGQEETEVPTILFVMEPDFPHLRNGGITNIDEDGTMDFYVHLNRDVDYLDLYLFTPELAPVAFLESYEDLSSGENDLIWSDPEFYDQLPSGDYTVVAFIGAGDVEEGYILGEFEK